MLWRRNRAEAAPQGAGRSEIVPVAPTVEFDDGAFRRHYATLLEAARDEGGIDFWMENLAAKHAVMAGALARDALPGIDEAMLEEILGLVFSARRRLHPMIAALGVEPLRGLLDKLLYGEGSMDARMRDFVAALPIEPGADREGRKEAARLRGAAHDFAAELLHFSDPQRYPLLTRWVWDEATMSGALREFVREADSASRLPLAATPEEMQGARAWFAERAKEEGVYRDVPLWIDLVLAAGYSHYFRTITGGVLGADFNRAGGPEDEIRKLLAIDPAPKSGRSRVKREFAR